MFPTEGLAKVRLADGQRRPRRVLAGAGLTAFAAGVTTLLARTGAIPSPPLLRPDLSTTAALALSTGAAAVLVWVVVPVGRGGPVRWLGRGLGAACVAAAATDLAAWVPGHPRPLTPPAVAAALLLCGLALTTVDLPVPGHLLAPAAVLVAPAGMGAHLPTLAVVALLCVAAGTTRPERGLARLLRTRAPAGVVVRYLTPAAAILALGATVLAPLAAAAVVLYAAGLVVARTLERDDQQRQRLIAALREQLSFSATLLQSMNDAVMVRDPTGRILDVNPRWCALVGRAREDLIGLSPPYPWQPEAEPVGVGPGTAAGVPRPESPGEQLVRRADGTAVPVLATVASVPDVTGRPEAYVSSYTDISERVRAEQVLSRHAAQVQEANSRLIRLNEKLAEAVGFKTDLINIVSHELSQPLSSVVSLAELLVSDWSGLSEDVRFDLATKIDRNSGRLVRMVADLVLLFRLDAGMVTARRLPVPVAPVVEAVAAAATSDVDIVTFVEPDLSVLVDREHLRQLLANLVSNAVEFGAAPVEVSARQRPDGVVLAVRDHGAGIPQELVPQLFQRFVRAGTVGASGRKGAGLGLYIAAHLVRINGGEIWYEPVVPHGAGLMARLSPAP